MKFSFKILSLSLLVFAMLSSCTDPDIVTKAEESTFNKEGAIVNVSGINPSFFDLGNVDNAEINFTLSTAGSAVSNADMYLSYNGGDFMLYKNVASFPSTENITLAAISDFFGTTPDAIAIGDAFTMKFISNAADGVYETSKQVTVVASCQSDLAGEYTAVTTYVFHDFLADYPTNTMDITVTEEGSGVYSVTDISGGLYSTGPYVAAYGTTEFPFTFTDVCNNISWSGQVDAFSQDVLVKDGSPSFVDADGVISITVLLSVYGEEWTIVMTPK